MHTLLEESFLKSKKPRLIDLQRCIDKIVCRRKPVLLSSLYKGKILEMRIVIKRYEVIKHDSEKAKHIDHGRIYIRLYYVPALLIASMVIFEVRTTVILTETQQGSEILLGIFSVFVYIKTSGNISRLTIVKKTESIICSLDSKNLRCHLHRQIFISGAVIMIHQMISDGTGFKYIGALSILRRILKPVVSIQNQSEF